MATPDIVVKKALDQIDDYQISAAESTISNALSKWPENIDVKAVNSLLQLRLGEVDEAAAIATDISNQAAAGTFKLKEGTVNVLAHVLQNTCCHAELAAVYERTVELLGGPAHKDTTAAQENLLNAYVLGGKLAEAQKLAMLLQKKTNKHDYTIRAMMCNIAQVPEDCKDSMLLKIATKMIGNTMNSNHCLTPQVGQMYVNLLIQQELFEDALKHVLSAQGRHLGLPEQRYAQLLKVLDAQLKNATATTATDGAASGELISTIKLHIAAVARQGWSLDADNWTFADRYIKAIGDCGDACACDKASSTAVDAFEALPKPLWSDVATCFIESGVEGWPVDCDITAALAFTAQQQEGTVNKKATTGAKCLRGPFMAEIVLLLKQMKQDVASSATEEIIKAKAVAYTRKFDTKGTCYLDLATLFADNACPSALTAVVEDLIAQEKNAAEDTNTAILELHRKRILRLKLQLLVTDISTATEYPDAKATIASCSEWYNACRDYSINLEWSEEGKVDGYLLIIANIALRQWYYFSTNGKKAEANQWLVEALSIINGMDRKKNNPGTLLFSTLFFQQLGIADVPALAQLDFKSVQHSSMHPVSAQPLLRGAAFGEVKQYFENATDKYYKMEKREMATLTAKIFQHLSWPKMGELKRFQQRLLRGLPRQEAYIYSALVKLRDTQTIKYTASHAVKAMKGVEAALVSACMSTCLGDKAAEEAVSKNDNKPITIADLWSAIASADETLPEDDDQFLMAFVFADLKSVASKAMQMAIVDKDNRKQRRQQVVLGAIGFMLLHDIAIYEAKSKAAAGAATAAAAAAAAAAGGAKGSKAAKISPAAAAAAAAAANNPFAKKAFMSEKYGLTADAIKGLTATSTTASTATKQQQAVVEILAALAEIVAEFTVAVNTSTAGNATEAAAKTKIFMTAFSPARRSLVAALKLAAEAFTAETTATASSSASKTAFSLLFPIGITLSSFMMLMPYPAEAATAFKDGLLKVAKEGIVAEMSAITSNASYPTFVNEAANGNSKSILGLVDDLLTDVNACSRRKL